MGRWTESASHCLVAGYDQDRKNNGGLFPALYIIIICFLDGFLYYVQEVSI